METDRQTVQATRELYEELQQAYDFFNKELFAGQLPGCFLTLQRKKDTEPYVRWCGRTAGVSRLLTYSVLRYVPNVP